MQFPLHSFYTNLLFMYSVVVTLIIVCLQLCHSLPVQFVSVEWNTLEIPLPTTNIKQQQSEITIPIQQVQNSLSSIRSSNSFKIASFNKAPPLLGSSTTTTTNSNSIYFSLENPNNNNYTHNSENRVQGVSLSIHLLFPMFSTSTTPLNSSSGSEEASSLVHSFSTDITSSNLVTTTTNTVAATPASNNTTAATSTNNMDLGVDSNDNNNAAPIIHILCDKQKEIIEQVASSVTIPALTNTKQHQEAFDSTEEEEQHKLQDTLTMEMERRTKEAINNFNSEKSEDLDVGINGNGQQEVLKELYELKQLAILPEPGPAPALPEGPLLPLPQQQFETELEAKDSSLGAATKGKVSTWRRVFGLGDKKRKRFASTSSSGSSSNSGTLLHGIRLNKYWLPLNVTESIVHDTWTRLEASFVFEASPQSLQNIQNAEVSIRVKQPDIGRLMPYILYGEYETIKLNKSSNNKTKTAIHEPVLLGTDLIERDKNTLLFNVTDFIQNIVGNFAKIRTIQLTFIVHRQCDFQFSDKSLTIESTFVNSCKILPDASIALHYFKVEYISNSSSEVNTVPLRSL